MKISEVIQRVQSLYSKGVQSDDTRLRSRHIFNKLETANIQLLNKKLDSNQPISETAYTIIDCQEIIKSDIFDCSCVKNPNCKIYRTKCKLPQISKSKNGYNIKYVIGLDGEARLNQTTFENLKYLSGNTFTSNKMWYFIKDDYLYFVNIMKLKYFRISAIFTDMITSQTFSCDLDNCIDVKELEFKTDDSLLDSVIQMTLQELINIFPKMQEDLTNDSKDNIIQQSK